MNIKVGDKVAVVDDVIIGIVSRVDADMIYLIDDTKMEFSFLATELIIIEESQSELTKYSDINNQLLNAKIQNENQSKQSVFKKSKNEVVFEVDLHINQLVNSTKNLDNYDMLNIQLETAKRKLEFAIKKRFSKMVFIHGVGEGVLKSELLRLLKNYPVKFYDASYQKYGLGATEVYIFQNPN